jgi:protein-S-isoprenylcysteine O-methyltransferase Ste14
MPIYTLINRALWLTWLGYWAFGARSAARGKSLEPRRSRLLHLGAILVSLALLFARPLHLGLPGGPMVDAAGDLITGLGLALTVWARVHLGQHWSGRVELKAEHRVVRSGPYAWLRHPIYAGVLLGVAGSAIVAGELTALLAVVVMLAAYLRKIRMEEAVLQETFGPEYAAYRRKVKALVPFVV